MKTNYFLFLAVTLFFSISNAQVGIGTTLPNGALDVVSSTDGLLIPRVALSATNVATVITPVESELVYNTFTSTPGVNAVTKGYYYWDGALWVKLNVGVNIDDWNLLGNTGSSVATNFIGTIDDVDLAMRRFNIRSGFLGNHFGVTPTTTNVKNTSFGANSLLNPDTGYSNTAIGTNVMTSNLSGFRNVGVGEGALNFNRNGSENTGIGVDALSKNNGGISNTAIGTSSLFDNTGGASNTAVGANALENNTLGGSNTAIGKSALNANVVGQQNVATGLNALSKNTESFNTANGSQALLNNTTGSNNTAFGNQALAGAGLVGNVTTGSFNTAVGNQSFYNNLTGANNVGLGNRAGFNELGSNKLYIENTNADQNTALIYGEFDTNILRTNSQFQIGNPAAASTGYSFPTVRPTAAAGQILQHTALGALSFQTPANALNSYAWLTTGNSGSNGGTNTAFGTNFIGTTDNQNLEIRTNNVVRMRIKNDGEVVINSLSSPYTVDLFSATGTVALPYPINGYSVSNGSGVWGEVRALTSTNRSGVDGIYNGTGLGSGVKGANIATTSGTGFGETATLVGPVSGVSGVATTTGEYKFGVYGSGGLTFRSGAVLGNDFNVAIGSLGYFASNNLDYSVYGFGQGYTNGGAGGRSSNQNNDSQTNTNIGLGIYGGAMGGWVRGLKYGFHTKGETYSLYVDGNGYTNKPLGYIIDGPGAKKIASFMTTAMTPEITVNGKINLQNGRAFVSFDKNFASVISKIDDVIITTSPQGKSNGVYVDEITANGFWIIENNDGISNTKIAWIAITKIKGEENPIVPNDLLERDFDNKMNNVMFNENNTSDEAQSLWWDGTKMRWDKPKTKKIDINSKLLKDNETKK